MFRIENYGKHFSKQVGEAVLHKLGKTKVEVLKDVFYCFYIVDKGKPCDYEAKMTVINKDSRIDYENKVLNETPYTMVRTNYSYQDCYIRRLMNGYEFRRDEDFFFNANNEFLYDDLVEYLVCYNVAAEIFH